MPPQPSHQSSFGVTGFSHQHAAPSSAFEGAYAASSAPSSSCPIAPRSGRKRSRDEASINLEADAVPPPPADPEAGWVYGPGMTLIKPDQGYAADAGTQSGTWVEERSETEKIARRKHEEAQRPVIRSHKSQRVDRSSSRSPLSFAARKSPLPTGFVADPDPANKVPEIDSFAIQLGIGWKRISEDEHIQAAARGWARFIENHYAISNAVVRLESKAHQSYLVQSDQGFFLFSENLRQGRLVSTNIVGAMQNLQSNPPMFEGVDTFYASEPPSPSNAQSPAPAPAPAMDAEMTMS